MVRGNSDYYRRNNSPAKSGNTSVEMINIVHLKNGSVIKGFIVEIILNEKIKIETPDGSVFVYEMSEVERPIELTVALES